MPDNDRRRLVSSLEIVTAAGLILFWAAFFTVGLMPDNAPACYLAYEHAFPLPDGLLAVLLLAAGIMLMQGRRWGVILSLAAGGGLVFLGLLDFSFNIQNGIYLSSTLDLVLNAFINLWCVGFGLALIIFVGRSVHA